MGSESRRSPEAAGDEPGARGARRVLRTVLDREAVAIITGLALEPATSVELAERLGLSTEAVRRLLRKLSERDQVTVGARVRTGASLENLYLADLRATVLDPSELASLPRHQVAAADLALARTMFREAAAAAESGVFARRLDSSIARYLIPVDDQGLIRAMDIHRTFVDRVAVEAGRARARIDRDSSESIPTSVHVLCFEHPFERWSRPSNPSTSRRRPGADRIERFFAHATDPLRSRILDLLSVLGATAATLADLLGSPVERVTYELDQLLAEGAVEVVGMKPKRGASERVFAADTRRNTFASSDFGNYDITVYTRWLGWVVKSIFGAALEAIGAEGAGADQGAPYLGRIVTAMDRRGFAKVEALTERALADLADLRDGGLEAGTEGRLPDHVILSGLLAFDRAAAPGDRDPRPR